MSDRGQAPHGPEVQAFVATAHRDDIIVGMRRKHYHPNGIGRGPVGTIGVIVIGLAARPACDGAPQVIKHP